MRAPSSSSRAILEGAYPLHLSERTWGPLALFGNCASAAVATWCFIIGFYVSFYLPAGIGTVAMLSGVLIGMFFIFMACVPMSTRYGLEAVRSTKPSLGSRGSLFTLALLFVFTLGWNTLLIIFAGRAGAAILIAGGVFSEGARPVAEVVVGLFALAAVWLLLRKGPDTLRNVGPVIAVSVLLLSAIIMVLLVRNIGWSAIADAAPAASTGNRLLDYTIGVELLIATALSWWPYVGGMVRYSTSTRKALLPVTAGLGLAVAVVSLIGLYAGLALPESGGDPTTFLIEVGGLGFGLLALAFIVIANIGTTMIGAYVAALALKQQPAIDRRLPWNGAVGLAVGSSALVLVFLSGPFFDNFGTFLAFSGLMFGPICGIQIAEYFIVRRQQLNVGDLYEDGAKTTYWYAAGINPIGFVSLIAGVGVYLALLDPITFESNPLFKYTTASVPAALTSLALYVVLTRLLRKTAQLDSSKAATGRTVGDTRAPAHVQV